MVVSRIEEQDSCEVEVPKGALRAYCGNSVLYFEEQNIDLVESLQVPAQMALFDADKLQWPLRLRRWREGDWFVPFGMAGKKKLSDLLIDQKLSLMEKQRQLVLLSGEDIIWVVGLRTDDRYRVDDRTEQVLSIHREIV